MTARIVDREDLLLRERRVASDAQLTYEMGRLSEHSLQGWERLFGDIYSKIARAELERRRRLET